MSVVRCGFRASHPLHDVVPSLFQAHARRTISPCPQVSTKMCPFGTMVGDLVNMASFTGSCLMKLLVAGVSLLVTRASLLVASSY